MAINQIYHWARLQPDKPAFIYQDVVVSYATFWRMIVAIRNHLAQQRLPSGQNALVLVHSIAESWAITLALRTLGLNAIALQKEAQARNLVLKDLACVVVTRPQQDAHPTPQYGDIPVILMPPSVYANCTAGDLEAPEQQHPFGGHILLTSATTGFYKKVLLEGKYEEKRNAVRAASWSLDTSSVLHGMDFPLATGAGFKQPTAVWHAGGCMIFEQRPERFERFREYGITHNIIVEAMLRPLLEKQLTKEQMERPFNLVFIAGFLSQALAEKTASQLTSNIAIHYACTELATYALYSNYKTRDNLFWMTVAADRVVQVVDEEGVECPAGIEGELRIQLTDIDSTGYLEDAETSAAYFRDGYFYPGDLAVARADGQIRILGRCSDVLNVQGTKIAVAPIEQAVKQHFSLEDVCIFSGMNDKGEEELVIAIQADAAPAKSEMETLHPSFKLFENLRIETFHEFPRAESGMRKIQRNALRSLAFADK